MLGGRENKLFEMNETSVPITHFLLYAIYTPFSQPAMK